MSARDALRRVVESLEPEWSQWGCKDVDGLFCAPDAEMVAVYDLHGAVHAHVTPGAEAAEVWGLLEAATPGGLVTLWVGEQGRTHAEVLAMVRRAWRRAEAES